MLEGKNILSFAPHYWDVRWVNRQQILSRLARKNRVLFVSPPFYIVDILRDLGKTTLHPSRTVKVSDNLYTHVPSKFLPYNHRFETFNRLCSYLRQKQILRILKELKMDDVILLIWNPTFVHEVGKYNEKLVVYYIYDKYSGYTNLSEDKQRIIDGENALLKKADLVITCSEMLYNEVVEKHPSVICIPNGVAFDLFQKAVRFPKTYPDIENIPKPRIGYVGGINRKVDFDLLLYLATRHPEWSIVLVGPELISEGSDVELVKKLKRLHNVFFLGFKEVQDVPYYINALDVGMMCYRINDWTAYGYPLKLHEYLACGKPTIGSPLGSLLEFEHVIRIARNPEEWERHIYESLAENDEFLYARGVQVARENSWDIRVEKLSEAIEKHLNKHERM